MCVCFVHAHQNVLRMHVRACLHDNQTFARLIFSVAKEQIVLDGIAHNESNHCHLALLALAVCAAYTCESAHQHGQP